MRISHILITVFLLQGLAMAAYAAFGDHSEGRARARAEVLAIQATPEYQADYDRWMSRGGK